MLEFIEILKLCLIFTQIGVENFKNVIFKKINQNYELIGHDFGQKYFELIFSQILDMIFYFYF